MTVAAAWLLAQGNCAAVHSKPMYIHRCMQMPTPNSGAMNT